MSGSFGELSVFFFLAAVVRTVIASPQIVSAILPFLSQIFSTHLSAQLDRSSSFACTCTGLLLARALYMYGETRKTVARGRIRFRVYGFKVFCCEGHIRGTRL